MPRKSRIDIPGLLYHVIVRGAGRRKIFLDDEDRAGFVARFSELLQETGTECHAWALLPNHFHLLLKPTREKLGLFMRRLLTGYAVSFNLRHNRSGKLFPGRYKSIVCEEETYLLELVRYIHLNPLRLRQVKDLPELTAYPWCGHAVLLGKREMAGQVVAEVLRRFENQATPARQQYFYFMVDGVEQGRRDELVGGGLRRSMKYAGVTVEDAFDDRILGSSSFVLQVRQGASVEKTPAPISLDLLVSRVAAFYQVDEPALLRRTRAQNVVAARGVISFLAVQAYGYQGSEVARKLKMERSGVSMAIRRGQKIVAETQDLQAAIERPEQHLRSPLFSSLSN